MSEVTWTVTEYSGKVTTTKSVVEKLAFVSPIKVTKEMDENQKKFFNTYNTMQKTLIDNGLMESK